MVSYCGPKISRLPIPVFLDFMHSSLDVPFPSSQEATIALRSLYPDREPRKGGISKQLSVSGSTLSVWEQLLEYDQCVETKAFNNRPCHMLNLVVSVFQEVDCWRSPDPPSVRELVYGSFVARAGNHGDVWTPSFALKSDWWYSTHIISSPLILCKDLTQVRHPVENMWNSLIC